ncbi:MAG: sigma-54-dependent Fis family transcriptional regulator [Deltaproteobacteria bacterium]|nr:sigma-54-dependent Fis family transcriptional regulator [Deltaproteobacteria bacterium]
MTPIEEQRVLVVDDEENMRLVLKTFLSREGYQIVEAANGAEGLACLDREAFDYILCDVRMPVMDGLTFLNEAKARGVLAPIIMLSAYGTVDSALEATKAGAFDYVFKPFNPDEILLTLKKAEERERLRRENVALRRAAAERPRAGIVARSKAMTDLLVMVNRVAEASSPVLITGESGTGKDLVARAIHEAGSQAEKPFVPVNCGAIPEKLLESEFFGHVRGAFTDAVQDRVGLFQEADGGTLFLDEVGELPLSLQVKLLRAIQEQEIRPVGASTPIQVDVRIVAATARNLSREVEAGQFREDLYYRLNVLPLFIPPLRERPEDIPLLLDHFLVAQSARMGRERPEISPEAAEALFDYSWPGNVRELENLVERILILSPHSRLEKEDVPSHIHLGVSKPGEAGTPDDLDLKAWIRNLEARLIKEALNQSEGNRSEAARRLKISYPSLLTKIKAYGLE